MRIFSILGACLALAVPAHAESVLADLERVHLELIYLSEEAIEAGVNEERLLRDVGLQLANADLIVYPPVQDKVFGPTVAFLFDTVEHSAGTVAYHASLEMREDVALIRDPTVTTSGSVWYASSFGTVDAVNLQESTPELILALVHDFLIEAGRRDP